MSTGKPVRILGVPMVHLAANEQLALMRLDVILIGTCRRHRITLEAIRGTARIRKLMDARAEFVRLARYEGFSFPAIGRALCRHHTTVMALTKVATQ